MNSQLPASRGIRGVHEREEDMQHFDAVTQGSSEMPRLRYRSPCSDAANIMQFKSTGDTRPRQQQHGLGMISNRHTRIQCIQPSDFQTKAAPNASKRGHHGSSARARGPLEARDGYMRDGGRVCELLQAHGRVELGKHISEYAHSHRRSDSTGHSPSYCYWWPACQGRLSRNRRTATAG